MDEDVSKIIKDYVGKEAPILSILTNEDREIIEINDYASELLGEDVLGENVKQIFVDFDGSVGEELDELSKKSLKDRLLNLDTAKDLPESFHFSFFPMDERILILGKPNIGELEKLQDEMVSLNNELTNISRTLQKKNRELRIVQKALESSLNAVAITNPDGDITRMNRALLELWGYEKKEIRGEDFKELLDDDQDMDTLSRDLEDDGGWSGELKARKKNNEIFDVLASAAVIKDEKGNREGTVFTFVDITERKNYEQREEFLHSLLRHDVSNKVQIIEGYLQLSEGYDLPDDVERFLSSSTQAIKSAKEIIKKVRTLREISAEDDFSEVNVGELLKKVIEEYESVFEEKGIQIDFVVEDIRVKGGSLLEEIFTNILENSIKHSDCDNIKISFEKTAEEITIKVEDDGRGISDDIKEKIFERGYKSGKAGGSGLGMYLVKEIAESYGGSVEVKDSDLGGARFDLYFERS
ncbi:MAG: PAS domain-containing protein [Candidatus Natronoplasma sp.]